MITKEQFIDICEVAKKYGVTSFSSDGTVISFSERAQPAEMVFPELGPRKIGEKFGAPTDDQMLFWSSDPMEDEDMATQPPGVA